MGKLEGKTALITGGNSGIGLATAKLFVDEGAFVFITGRRQAELDSAVAFIGRNAVAIQSDVSSLSDLDRVFTTIKSQAGKLDIIFVNAGVAEFRPIELADEQHFDKIFDINVKGAYFTVQKSLPLLVDGSSIIFNSSAAGIKGFATTSVYSATKAALRSFARTLTSDLKSRQIRVNTVSPGPIETPIFNTLGNPEIVSHIKESFTAAVPLGRMGTSDEIAKIVLFLASSDSSYITGIDLFADGGAAQV